MSLPCLLNSFFPGIHTLYGGAGRWCCDVADGTSKEIDFKAIFGPANWLASMLGPTVRSRRRSRQNVFVGLPLIMSPS